MAGDIIDKYYGCDKTLKLGDKAVFSAIAPSRVQIVFKSQNFLVFLCPLKTACVHCKRSCKGKNKTGDITKQQNSETKHQNTMYDPTIH